MLIYRLFTWQLTSTIVCSDLQARRVSYCNWIMNFPRPDFHALMNSPPKGFLLAQYNCAIIIDLTDSIPLEARESRSRVKRQRKASMLLYKLLFLLPSTQIALDFLHLRLLPSLRDAKCISSGEIYRPNNLKRQRSSLILFTLSLARFWASRIFLLMSKKKSKASSIESDQGILFKSPMIFSLFRSTLNRISLSSLKFFIRVLSDKFKRDGNKVYS